MKQTSILIACLTVAALFTGCAGNGIAGVAKALAVDNATVVADVMTPYGHGRLVRTNPGTNHSATITPDGSVTIRNISDQ